MAKVEVENTSSPEIILWPTLTDSILEKSDLHLVTFTQNEEIYKESEISSVLRVEAVKEVDLERIAALNLSEQHAETYHKFSYYVQKGKDDDFYKRVLEYKQHYFSGQLLIIKLEILKDSCKEISEKCWNLISKQAQYDLECGDGRMLSCFTTIDSAVFNQNKANELVLANNQVLDLTKEMTFNNYLLKVAKLYIQNYLDVFLQDFLELLLSFSTLRDKMEGWKTFQIIGIIIC